MSKVSRHAHVRALLPLVQVLSLSPPLSAFRGGMDSTEPHCVFFSVSAAALCDTASFPKALSVGPRMPPPFPRERERGRFEARSIMADGSESSRLQAHPIIPAPQWVPFFFLPLLLFAQGAFVKFFAPLSPSLFMLFRLPPSFYLLACITIHLRQRINGAAERRITLPSDLSSQFYSLCKRYFSLHGGCNSHSIYNRKRTAHWCSVRRIHLSDLYTHIQVLGSFSSEQGREGRHE